MSDFTWYSRLVVWIGVVILAIQSITGRGAGPLTLVAVLCVFLGLFAFLGGLAFADRQFLSLSPTTAVPKGSAETEPAAEQPAAEPRHHSLVSEETPPPLEPEQQDTVQPSVSRTGPLRTAEVAEGASEFRLRCVYCDKALTPGQISVTCDTCGAEHHAGCWAANRFHCATPGCERAGSLQAPEVGANDSDG